MISETIAFLRENAFAIFFCIAFPVALQLIARGDGPSGFGGGGGDGDCGD